MLKWKRSLTVLAMTALLGTMAACGGNNGTEMVPRTRQSLLASLPALLQLRQLHQAVSQLNCV